MKNAEPKAHASPSTIGTMKNAEPKARSLKSCIASAARLLNKGANPIGLMGERLSKAVATIAGCAMHDPTLHFGGHAFEGVLGREEWMAPWSDFSDVTNRYRLVPEDTWVTRWSPGAAHQAPFKPYCQKGGPVVLYVHEGALQIGVGYSTDGERPPMTSRFVLGPGSRFEAVNPGTWLALCPLAETTMTCIGLKPGYDLNTTHANVLQQTLVRHLALLIADGLK